MIDLIILGASLASVPVGYLVGRAIGRRPAPATTRIPDDTCTGYSAATRQRDGKFGPFTMHTDCHALRSALCSDGRCSFHCAAMCRCNATNDPEFTGRRRS